MTAPGAEARVFVGAGGGVRALGAGAAHPVHRPADHVAALAVVTHVVPATAQRDIIVTS